VANSSTGCSSSNFVNVTMTRIVGTIGMAIWNKTLQKVRGHYAKIDINASSAFHPWQFSLEMDQKKILREPSSKKKNILLSTCKNSFPWELPLIHPHFNQS
jgi:hypothetical protein